MPLRHPFYGTHPAQPINKMHGRLSSGIKRLVSHRAITPGLHHALRMPCLECELPKLLDASRPPDPELVDLIEQAFIDGQIDSQKAKLAYWWLMSQK